MHSDDRPDGTEIVVEPDWIEPQQTIGAVLLGEHGAPTDIAVRAEVRPDTPPLWYAELRELTGRPPAVSMLAFSGAGVAPGRLLDRTAAGNVDVTTDDQLAAIRWYPATGEIDQIYVAPHARRRGIATVLLHAAGMLSVANGWGRLWSDGQRTMLGEHLRNSRDWQHRAADLTHIAPPMTPGEAASPEVSRSPSR